MRPVVKQLTGISRPEDPRWACEGRLRSCEQSFSGQGQVAEGEQGEELCRVLGEAVIPDLLVSELALEHPERALEPGPHLNGDPSDGLV